MPPDIPPELLVPPELITIDSAFVAVFARLSETCTVKFAVAATLGVPEMTPPVDRVKPVGNAPALSDHVYGAVPPVAARVCE